MVTSETFNVPEGSLFLETSKFDRREEVASVYKRLIGSCGTINQLNKIHILFDRRNSGIEREAVDTALREELVQARYSLSRWGLRRFHKLVDSDSEERYRTLKKWQSELESQEKLAGLTGISKLKRVFTTSRMSYYADPTLSNAPLVVGWAGKSHRLMMPVANYLPSLGLRGANLLVLFPGPESNSRNHAVSSDSGVRESIAFLRKFVRETGATRVAVIGTSLGSLPALASAPLIEATHCSIVGPSDPYSGRAEISLGLMQQAWATTKGIVRPKLTITFGQDALKDVQAAQVINRALGGHLHPVHGEGHNPIFGMFKKRTFDGWVHSTLFEAQE